MSYTYEQLKQMGATPGTPSGSVSGTSPQAGSAVPKNNYTYEELVGLGATAPKKEPWKQPKSVGGFAGNVVGSTAEVVGGLAKAVLNPIDTTKSLFNLTKGLGAKVGEKILEKTETGQKFLIAANESRASRGLELLPTNEQGRVTLQGSSVLDDPNLKMVNAVGDFYVERYGDWDKIKETMYEDPVGFALDLSTVLSGGGAIAGKLDKLNKVSKASEAVNVTGKAGDLGKVTALGKTSDLLRKGGEVTNPITQGGRLFGKGIEKLTKDKKLGGKKYTSENIDASQNIGVAADELPIFAKTTSPISTTAEAVASKGIGGSKIWDRMNNIYTKMNDTVDSLLNGKLDVAVIGRNLSTAVDDFKNNFFEQKNKLYKEAIIPKPKVANEIPGYENIKTITVGAEDPLFASWNMKVLPNGKYKYTKPTGPLFSGKQKPMPANTVGTQKLLKSLIANEKQALKGYGTKSSPELKTYEGLLKGLGDKNMTTSDVYRTLQKLSNDIRYGTIVKTGNNAKLSLIRESLDAEFLATLKQQRPDLAAALDKAETFYKQGVSKLNSSVIQTIVKNADKPDLIVKTLLPKLTSLEDVKLLVEVVGQKNMVAIRKSIMDVIFTEAKGVAKENLQPLGISKQIKKFGEDKLEILLNPDQFKALKDLEQISKMMGKSSKITGGSQTSFNLLSTVGGGSVATSVTLLLMGNPVGAMLSLSPLFGTIAAGKFINSNLGRKLLAEGVNLTGKTGQKIQAVSPSTGRGAQIGNQLNNLYDSQK